jgi:type IV pilus biogenesis protein CpaD/CtpE
MRPLVLSAGALAALALAACNQRDNSNIPAGSKVAASMPDTDAPREPDRAMTAPDAGVTGAAEPVPREGGVGNAAGATVPNPEAAAR